MTARLFLLQRASAAVLAVFVAVHLATILFVMRGGLTAGEILARTRGNGAILAFYLLFVLAVAIHAPIGLRNVSREWLGLSGRAADAVFFLFAMALTALGFRAVFALYLA
jgi:fumarate reductase subunit C